MLDALCSARGFRFERYVITDLKFQVRPLKVLENGVGDEPSLPTATKYAAAKFRRLPRHIAG